MERHSWINVFWDKFDKDFLFNLNVLQFSNDPGINSTWFKTYLVSTSGAKNSLDVQKIDKPNQEFNVVIYSKVTEHVPNDRKSIKELLRVIKKRDLYN